MSENSGIVAKREKRNCKSGHDGSSVARSEPRSRVVIDIRGLTVSYDDKPVLKDVDLKVYDKDFLGIIGPNGGGKTTLLKAILGLKHIEKGRIRILGKPPAKGRRVIGYVPQQARFDKDFPISVWEIVLMGRLSRKGWRPWFSKDDKEAATRALRAVDMLDHKDDRIDNLSGGQRQRIYIARALAADPKILLLDEPTSSVDTKIQAGIYDLLKDLRERMTIILVTHDVGVISTYVNRVGCLNLQLHAHDDPHLTKEMLEETYHCPVDLIAHGVPHRVFEEHP